MRIRWLLVPAILASAPAFAKTLTHPLAPEPPPRPARVATLAIESGATVAGADLVVHDAHGTSIATVTLTLTATQVMAASTTLALPDGARVVGMTLSHGDLAFVARPLELVEAQSRFVAAVEPQPFEVVVPREAIRRDPAILQLDDDGVVRLTVYPIEPGAPATVTVQLAMPTPDRTRLVVGGQLARELFGAAPATAADVELAAHPTPLAPGQVLYAAPLADEATTVNLQKTLFDVQTPLSRCAHLDEGIAGVGGVQDVSLAIQVDARGHASLVHAEGASATLTYCLQEVVEQLRYRDDAPTTLTDQLRVTAASESRPARLARRSERAPRHW